MEKIFTKTKFSKAPGGDVYEWDDAMTSFETNQEGIYVIKIVASAKNENQNKTQDDDDLRIVLDGYVFGKYEVHEESVSWKGFGTAASWDGSNLCGADKMIYIFVKLLPKKHTISFVADETPTIRTIDVYQLQEGAEFSTAKFQFNETLQNKKGIPFVSFIFLGIKPKFFNISALCKSAKQKRKTDDDGVKVIINGKILKNDQYPTSDKYKNFYFSGDIEQGQRASLAVDQNNFEFLEDSIELWYDQSPEVSVDIQLFESIKSWWEQAGSSVLDAYYNLFIWGILQFFNQKGYYFSGTFFRHSITKDPHRLVFSNNTSFVEKIKKDLEYKRILSLIKKEISKRIVDGQIIPGENESAGIAFNQGDLFFALHGIKKVQFIAKEIEKNTYETSIILLDVYDFDRLKYCLENMTDWGLIFGNNQIDQAEARGMVKNFEVEIRIQETIKITKYV